MIYALDKIAPGMANIDTLLYGVEVKFYNSRVDVDENLETAVKGLYVLGDGSGVTHSLSQASASGVFAARTISENSTDLIYHKSRTAKMQCGFIFYALLFKKLYISLNNINALVIAHVAGIKTQIVVFAFVQSLPV